MAASVLYWPLLCVCPRSGESRTPSIFWISNPEKLRNKGKTPDGQFNTHYHILSSWTLLHLITPPLFFSPICHFSLAPSHLIAIRPSSDCFRLGRSIPKLCFPRSQLILGEFSSFSVVCFLWKNMKRWEICVALLHLVSGSFSKFLYLFDLELYCSFVGLVFELVLFIHTQTPTRCDLFALMFLGWVVVLLTLIGGLINGGFLCLEAEEIIGIYLTSDCSYNLYNLLQFETGSSAMTIGLWFSATYVVRLNWCWLTCASD